VFKTKRREKKTAIPMRGVRYLAEPLERRLLLSANPPTALPLETQVSIAALAQPSAQPGLSPSFVYGNQIAATTNSLSVRSTAGGILVGYVNTGYVGTVVGGPQNANLNGVNYTWYEVSWDSGISGWSAQNYLAALPTVTTSAATNVTVNSAQLNGLVNPNGTSTSVYFQYGATTSYGGTSSTLAIGSGTSAMGVQAQDTGRLGISWCFVHHYRSLWRGNS